MILETSQSATSSSSGAEVDALGTSDRVLNFKIG